MAELELHAHLKIRPGQLDGFKKQAAECLSRRGKHGHHARVRRARAQTGVKPARPTLGCVERSYMRGSPAAKAREPKWPQNRAKTRRQARCRR